MICRECRSRGQMVESGKGTITQSYNRKGSDVTVKVSGIPADICSVCGETYIDLEVAKQLDRFVQPLLAYGLAPHPLGIPKVMVRLDRQPLRARQVLPPSPARETVRAIAR